MLDALERYEKMSGGGSEHRMERKDVNNEPNLFT